MDGFIDWTEDDAAALDRVVSDRAEEAGVMAAFREVHDACAKWLEARGLYISDYYRSSVHFDIIQFQSERAKRAAVFGEQPTNDNTWPTTVALRPGVAESNPVTDAPNSLSNPAIQALPE